VAKDAGNFFSTIPNKISKLCFGRVSIYGTTKKSYFIHKIQLTIKESSCSPCRKDNIKSSRSVTHVIKDVVAVEAADVQLCDEWRRLLEQIELLLLKILVIRTQLDDIITIKPIRIVPVIICTEKSSSL